MLLDWISLVAAFLGAGRLLWYAVGELRQGEDEYNSIWIASILGGMLVFCGIAFRGLWLAQIPLTVVSLQLAFIQHPWYRPLLPFEVRRFEALQREIAEKEKDLHE